MKNMFTFETNQKILKVSGVLSILLGFVIAFFPKIILQSFGVEIPNAIELWQVSGFLVAAIGVGFYVASQDSNRYWLMVLVGFIANLLISLLFLKAIVTGSLPFLFATVLFIYSAVWLVPFYCILQEAYDDFIKEDSPPKQFSDLIRFARTSQNKTLLELSNQQNVLLVFVRHFGCTFCRETVSEMAKIDQAITGKKLLVVFVHMSDRSYGDEFFSKYYDHPVHHVSDPGRALYKSLNLRRGSIYQLFGPMTWIRGIYAGLFKGHGLGEFEGDSMQLGGVFILSHGQIVFEQKAESASHLFQISTLPEV